MQLSEIHPKTIGVSEAEVRSELDRIVAASSFQRCPQIQRFLRFVVDEALAGNKDSLKEYVVATEVFGRPANYDPRLDSLVRVEAHRLRILLDSYYKDEGRNDPLIIALHKGSYVPIFQPRAFPERRRSVVIPSRLSRRMRAWIAIAGTVAFALAAVWLYRVSEGTRPRLPRNATIAVLPFDNLSTDPENQYFSFGLTDEITTNLAKAGELRVVARTSASRFKRGDDIPTIGRQLKADAVLEGSVQKYADRVRVTAQLISTADNLHVWSESYDRPSSDLLRSQNEIAVAVASGVRPFLTGNGGRAPHGARFSTNAEANQMYWKAAYWRSPMGKTGWRKDLTTSAKVLEQAVKLDPEFGVAYAALADVYVSQAWERGGGPVTRDFMTRGRLAALRALELDSTLAEAYGALGTVQFFYDYDSPAAEKSFQHALEFDPSNGKVRMWYAQALVTQGRNSEALTAARLASELDPLSYVATTHLAVVNFMAHRNDETIRLAREALQVSDSASAHGVLGMAYEVQQNFDAAIAEYQAGLHLVPNHSYLKGMLGHAYAKSGRTQEALALLKNAGTDFERGGLSPLRSAYIYMGLGDRERVFQLLEQGCEQRDPDLPYINGDPVFDPVRSDPHFIAILQKMHLSPS
ncbi:MAG: tetratricopeptide repeat protein [Terriglobales bacterium]